MELAMRYSNYKPENVASDRQEEITMALNWFFKGQKNKLTMQISQFDYELLNTEIPEKWRFRIQWDISF